jgi:hypothetical protein
MTTKNVSRVALRLPMRRARKSLRKGTTCTGSWKMHLCECFRHQVENKTGNLIADDSNFRILLYRAA